MARQTTRRRSVIRKDKFAPRNRRLLIEALEDRRLLSLVTWTGAAGTPLWSNPANWSTGALPGPGDDVEINASAGVTVEHDAGTDQIHSLISSSPFTLSGGSLDVATTVEVDNVFTISGGTLQDATIQPGSGGQGVTVESGTLDNVTLNGDVTVSTAASLTVTNGLELNGVLTLDCTSDDWTSLYFDGTQELKGTGDVEFGGTYTGWDGMYARGGGDSNPATLTIGPGITVQGSMSGLIGGQYNNDSVVNQGTIDADTAGQTITIGVALTGGVLNWSNAGLLQTANGGTLNLSGQLTTAGLGTFSSTGGTVNLTGTLDNTGTTLALTAATGSLTLSGGTIQGGTVTASGGSDLVSANGTLDGVTLNGDVTVSTAASLTVTNGLELNGVLTLDCTSDDWTSLYFDGTQELKGTGDVEFGGTYTGWDGMYARGGGDSNPATLTIGPGITVQGSMSGLIGGQYNNDSVVNQGTIDADTAGQTITIGVALTGGVLNWSNAGLLQTANGGTLNLSGQLTTAGLGTFSSTGGTVNLTGTLDNTGTTLALTAATGSLTLSGGTIQGGTVTASGGSDLVSANGTLDGVTLNGDVTVSTAASLTVTNGLELNGVLTLDCTSDDWTSLYFDGTQELKGTGDVEFGGTYTGWDGMYARGDGDSNPATLTIGPGITVQGSMSGLIGGQYNNDSVVNQGTIDADTAGQTITIGVALTGGVLNWSNAGLLQTANGGTLNLSGQLTTAGLGTFSSTGGTVNLTGTLDNTGTTLALTAATGSLTLSGGTIQGGTVTASGGSDLVSANGTLDGVTLNGDVTVSTAASLTVTNGLELNGVLTLDCTSDDWTSLYFDGTQELKGTGDVEFGGTYTGWDGMYARGDGDSNPATLTIGPGITVQGSMSGLIGGQYNNDSVVNQGTINADTAGQTITIGVALTGGVLNWSNAGLLQTASGGTLNLSGQLTTAGLGTFSSTGGTVNLTGTLDNTGTTLALTAATGSLTLSGGTIQGGTVTASGGSDLVSANGTLDGVTLGVDLTLSGSSSLFVKDGLTLNNANVMFNNSGYYNSVFFQGTQELGGTGQIIFGGGTYPGNIIYAQGGNTVATAATLTIGPNITVQGSEGGTIAGQYPQDSIINQGTIDADASGQTITVSGSNWVNTGLLEAADNGMLNLGGTFTTSGMGTFNGTGGTVNVTGALDNTGSTLVLTAATGSLSFSGTIKNGTVIGSGDAQLIPLGGTLDGVTLGVDLTLSGSSSLFVKDGLTLNNANVMFNNSGYYNSVFFQGTQTLGGTGQIIFGGGTYPGNIIYAQGGDTVATAATLTIGPNITVQGTDGGTITGQFPQDSIINQGTIDADAAGQTIAVNSNGTFTNQGTLSATGGTLVVDSSVAVNGSGLLASTAGNTISVIGNLLGNTQDASLYTPQGTLLLNGSGTAANPQLLEVMGRDVWVDASGYTNNFDYGTLALAADTYVRLVDQSQNTNSGAPEALYVNSLIVPAGATLDLNGLHLYTGAAQIGGSILNGTIVLAPSPM